MKTPKQRAAEMEQRIKDNIVFELGLSPLSRRELMKSIDTSNNTYGRWVNQGYNIYLKKALEIMASLDMDIKIVKRGEL